MLLPLILVFVANCDGGTFWHISDLHLDYFYTGGGNSSNFCHKISDGTDSDVKDTGDYNCDSPQILVESALKAMQLVEPNPEFIVWTGDSAPHWRDPEPPSLPYISNVTKFVFTKLDQYFPNIPIVPALGNHDASPPDQFPITNTNDTHEFYDNLWSDGAFGDHIDIHETNNTFYKCGYYTKTIKMGPSDKVWRFIVLNTNIYYSDEMTTGEDPCDQLQWMNQTLTNSSEDESVFIVAHVPPGSFERDPGNLNFNSPKQYAKDINKKYIQIVTDPVNSAKITAHLYGHLHTDTFRIFLDRANKSTPVGVAFMAGSVTPTLWIKKKPAGVNPTIRLMEISESVDPPIITEYTEYFLNLTETSDDDDKEEEVVAKNSRRKNAKFLEDSQEEFNQEETNKRERRSNEEPVTISEETTTHTSDKTNDTENATDVNILKDNGETSTDNDEETETTMSPSERKTNETETVNANVTISTPSQLDLTNSKTNVLDIADVANEVDEDTKDDDDDPATILAKKWVFLYKATKTYKVTDLSPKSMFEAYKRMVKFKQKDEAFMDYYKFNTGGHDVGQCDAKCWRGQLCTMTNLILEELTECLSSSEDNTFYKTVGSLAPQLEITTNVTRDDSGTEIPYEDKATDEADNPGPRGSFTTPSGAKAPNLDFHNENDHSKDTMDDHEDIGDLEDEKFAEEHDEDYNSNNINDNKDVTKEKIENSGSSVSAVGVFFGIVAIVLVMLAAGFGYKKYRDNRYRNQEFLLTDSVFRYDGYSQLDDA